MSDKIDFVGNVLSKSHLKEMISTKETEDDDDALNKLFIKDTFV